MEPRFAQIPGVVITAVLQTKVMLLLAINEKAPSGCAEDYPSVIKKSSWGKKVSWVSSVI